MQRIYLDNAATTPLKKSVFEKMSAYFTQEYGNADSPHATGRKAMAAVDSSRDLIAQWLGAKPKEIYFTSGGTESDNWAIIGAARAQKKQGRGHVLLSSIEHHAALFAAEILKEEGFEVEQIPVNEGGRVALNTISGMIRPDTALVCVMRVNNETGIVQPVKEIAEIAHSAGALCFVDAVQSAPHERINVGDWGVDLLSVSSHKLHGPKGCGALYIKSGVKIERLVGGGEQERGLRGGTLNVPAIVGFAAAVQALDYPQTEAAIHAACEAFLQEISTLDGISFNGDRTNAIDGVLSIRVAGVDNATLLYKTDLAGLSIAAGSACSSASVKPSHVLTAMGLDERAAKESVRVSFSALTSVEEAKTAGKIFVECVQAVRGVQK